MDTTMPTNQRDRQLTLRGTRILLVEDEYFIADDVRRILSSAGAEIIGPVATVAKANAAIDQGAFNCVVLDLNLHGDSAIPIADRLIAEGRKFAIATGYGSSAVPDHLKDMPKIEKPFDPDRLLKLMEGLYGPGFH